MRPWAARAVSTAQGIQAHESSVIFIQHLFSSSSPCSPLFHWNSTDLARPIAELTQAQIPVPPLTICVLGQVSSPKTQCAHLET